MFIKKSVFCHFYYLKHDDNFVNCIFFCLLHFLLSNGKLRPWTDQASSKLGLSGSLGEACLCNRSKRELWVFARVWTPWATNPNLGSRNTRHLAGALVVAGSAYLCLEVHYYLLLGKYHHQTL